LRDADLQVAFAVVAAAYEGWVQADRDWRLLRRRIAELFTYGGRNRASVQPLRAVRTVVLNGTLEDAFPGRYPALGYHLTNDNEAIAAAA
jgi:hypothetical protein